LLKYESAISVHFVISHRGISTIVPSFRPKPCVSPVVIAELHDVLKPFLLRRIKAEVVKDLPVKSEVILYHGLSDVQKKYYKAILTKDLGKYDE
jgi:hypothetical protein